jgi:predicted dehydrogenase
MEYQKDRRRFLKVASAAGLTTNLFTGQLRGANDRVAVGYIGLGQMGQGNLKYSMEAGFQPAALCDVYQPHLEKAEAIARQAGHQVKSVKDFREVISDNSIDAICISAPDHWHPYMTVEACKAGKDVYVEKPACVYVEEGQKMIAAARKYNRVVQGGTMQRSGGYFKKAAEVVSSGTLGDVTFVHTWQAGNAKKEGWGNPPDTEPPAGLDWDLWLGPAPKVPYNLNRFGVAPNRWSTFRYFWDYAGGAMTDWGVHLIDPVHQCFDDKVMPQAISSHGGKYYVEDNVDTPDTLLATFEYPQWLLTYESRTTNPMPMFGHGAGTSIHGSDATLIVNRSGVWVVPNKKESAVEPVTLTRENAKEMSVMNVPHWQNFLDCIKTRQRPTSDIENCVKSSVVCILGNIAYRTKLRLNWDAQNWTVQEKEAKPYLKANYRKPWKLEI